LEKFHSEEQKLSGIRAGREHKVKDIFVSLNIVNTKYIFLLMVMMQLKERT
jgi:hypothetical protein